MPAVYACRDCSFSTLFEAGAYHHSEKFKHFIVETENPPGRKVLQVSSG